MAIFSEIQEGDRRYLVLQKSNDFGHTFYCRVSFCISLPNLMRIRPSIHDVEMAL